MTNHHEILRRAIGGGGTNIINITSFIASKTKEEGPECAVRKKPGNYLWTKLSRLLLDANDLKQYIGVILCVTTLWGAGCFVLGESMWPGGYIFDMSLVVMVGYMVGHTLERLTTLSPIVGMTLVGAVYRNIGGDCFLDNKAADVLDFHLRRVYPVIILTRGPLGWNWGYIRDHPVGVFSLATLPWMVECLSLAFLSHTLLKFSWYWGLHLGSILSSVSPAVVVPTMMALNARGFGTKHQVAFLVANAGGLDTAVSEGIFGVVNSAIFYPSSITYKIVKAVLAIVLGVGIGILWGFVVDWIPGHKDLYAPTVRSSLIFSGGLLLTYAGGYIGWGGTSGVAVMVCAATAATRWSNRDWPINNNPVFEVYKLLWTIFEPMLFTLSGYYLDISSLSWHEFGLIVCCIMGALAMRLLTAFLVALASNLSLKESILIAVTWIPKAIVEAVLVRVATDSITGSQSAYTKEDHRIAKSHANIIVIAILITSTLGSGLTTYLGPILLSKDSEVSPGEFGCYDSSANSAPERRHSSMLPADRKNSENDCAKGKSRRYKYFCSSSSVVTHYVTLVVLGFLTWGLLWVAWGDAWCWDGHWFKLTAVAVLAWASGQVFESVTTLPPLLAALTVGIAARNLGLLDVREYPEVDGFLRKIYPVIILGKGSLGWNLSYMRLEWKQLAVLGVIPWALEVVTLSVCTQYLLGFPWLWGVMLGSFYASVSCPVLMPSVIRLQKSLEPTINWQQLYCTAGGLDTMLSVGVFGIVFSYLFFNVNETYRIVKASTTLFIGVAMGAAWGSMAKFTPHSDDAYVASLRVLFVLLGGLFLNFFTLKMGWGGVGGVAVLACNATAALHWSKANWPLNRNPAATSYQVLWSACEPTLFAFTGTYVVLNERTFQVVPLALGILLICLAVRLTAAGMVSWKVISFREKLFLCCTWTPKSIVEAVLCPMALNTLIAQGIEEESQMYEHAEDIVRVTVVAIYITTPLAYLLTNHLGPAFLNQQNNKNVLPTAK